MVRLVIKLLFSLTLVASFSVHAANISVKVDRNPVQLNESFHIVFQSDGTVDDDPDFSPLEKDFEILSQGQSSNIQIINGSMSRQSRWTLTAIAKRAGDLTIPAIEFGDDRSQAKQLKVVQQAPSSNDNRSDLFVEAKVDRTTAYVQSQLLYTIRFYRAVNINGASMSEPEINGGEVVVEKLGEDAMFETRHNGRRYVVVERKYALFPQLSGKLSIDPINMTVQVLPAMRNNLDPFGRNAISKRISSDAIDLNIKPIPASMQGKPWIPASEVKLTESWSEENDFKIGEPITRTLTLQAAGLTGAQLPELMPAEAEGFKTYPDQASFDDQLTASGLLGIRQEKIALIPTQAGELTLPAVEIPWWNINSNKLEVAKLPSRTIQVKAGSSAPSLPPVTTAQPSHIENNAQVQTVVEPGPWFAIAMALGLGWLLTIIAWVLKARQVAPMKNNQPDSSRPSLKKFQRACQQNDPKLARSELLAWAKNYWQETPPLGIDEVAQRLGPQAQQQINELNRSLYGNGDHSWSGAKLGETVEKAVKALPKKGTKEHSADIPLLYPST